MKADRILTGDAIWCDMADVETAADHIYEAAMKSGIKFDGVFSPHEQVRLLIQRCRYYSPYFVVGSSHFVFCIVNLRFRLWLASWPSA